jgi:hypothetical protein
MLQAPEDQSLGFSRAMPPPPSPPLARGATTILAWNAQVHKSYDAKKARWQRQKIDPHIYKANISALQEVYGSSVDTQACSDTRWGFFSAHPNPAAGGGTMLVRKTYATLEQCERVDFILGRAHRLEIHFGSRSLIVYNLRNNDFGDGFDVLASALKHDSDAFGAPRCSHLILGG